MEQESKVLRLLSGNVVENGAKAASRDVRRPALPFAHLNLRRNPFGEIDPGERSSMAVVEGIERLVECLAESNFAVQFLGDKGRGKTTHLLALFEQFSGAAYVHIPEGKRPAVPRGRPLFIDELQRVRRRERRRLMARGVPLAIGSHRDHSRELNAAGYTVETIHPGERVNATMLRRALAGRIEAARRGDGPVPAVSDRTVERLLSRFGSDVRAMERHLYDRFQNLETIGDV